MTSSLLLRVVTLHTVAAGALGAGHTLGALGAEHLGEGYCSGPSGSRLASLLAEGWKRNVSIEECEAQCAKDGTQSSCDGFEFAEDYENGCRLLKGSIAKASGDNGPFQRISCFVNGWKIKGKADAEAAERNKYMQDLLAPTCDMFMCPAGHRRAPKLGFAPWSYGCSHVADEALNDCCAVLDTCFRTCGMSSSWCSNKFMQCVMKHCDPKKQEGDPCIKKAFDVIYETGTNKEERCNYYEDAQVEACECVPELEFQTKFEGWLEGFYAKHQPDKLDDSKKLKNSEQIWKKWSNKESELLHTLVKKYKGAVEHRNLDESEVEHVKGLLKNALAEEDYVLAKRIKRRQTMVTKALEMRANSTASTDSTGDDAKSDKSEGASSESVKEEL